MIASTHTNYVVFTQFEFTVRYVCVCVRGRERQREGEIRARSGQANQCAALVALKFLLNGEK